MPPDGPTRRPSIADVVDITVDRPAAELRVTYDDGVSGAIALEDLREHCPCATCRAARQQGRPTWQRREGRPPMVSDAQLVGAWGLGIQWDDGHATGIYPFTSLHTWILDGRPSLNPDSGLGP